MKRYQLFAADEIRCPHIYSIGFATDPEVTRFGPSVRNKYIIHYVLSGKGNFNGTEVGRGEGFLITPSMKEEHYYPSDCDPWEFLWVISEDPEMEYFFERHMADPETGVFEFHAIHEMEALARELTDAKSSISSSPKLSETFLHIFNTCIASDSLRKASLSRVYFEFSVNYIKTNINMSFSVSDLCSAIGITQPYLYRIFKEEVGCSPKNYISEYRIKLAKKLLAETEFSVSAIADSVGFKSVLDFSKFFSKRTGVSPTEYRKESR